MMIETGVKIIKLANVKKGTHHQHKIEDSHPKIHLLTWYEFLQIIQLYEPTANLNEILIQVKIDQLWQYITNTFAFDLRLEGQAELQIRYKLYELPKISAERKLLIEQELAKCQSNLKQYQTRFDINSVDINVFWASPVFSRDYREGSNKTYPVNWKVCCQGFINQIGIALKKSHKRVYFTTNLLNKDCFSSKNYSIVYLLCQTECYMNRAGTFRKQYLVGETSSGELVEILPKKLHQMLKETTIELLIFHTSFPYYHLEHIMSCQNIKNILLIKSSPVYHSDSTSFFLNRFFSELLSGVTIRQAHRRSVKQVQAKFMKDEMCCCYHLHRVQCQFHPTNCSFMKFTTDHYRQHKIDKKANICCCPSIDQQIYDYSATHKIESTFEFARTQQDFQERAFDFQNGELQGDAIYLKGFQTRQSLLGNRHILPKLLQIFEKPKNYKKGPSYSRILNIYNKMCGDKLIFIENLTNFLIRRKVFVENRIYELKNNENLRIDKNPDILYTLFSDQLSLEQIKKLKQFEVNIIIVSQKKLNVEKVDSSFESIEIKPLEKKDCMNYIKAQKHLCQVLKDKVAIFFEKTWSQMFKFVYYPSNFDYNGLMGVISGSLYEKDSKKYIESIRMLKNKDLLEEYILFMSLSSRQTMQEHSKYLREFKFYRQMTLVVSPADFIDLSVKYFHLVSQQFFKDIFKFLISILMCLVKITFPSLRRGVCLFQATTDCYQSVTFTFFKRTIQKCLGYKINEKLQEYFASLKTIHIIQSSLSFVKSILTCFYLYDVLDYKEEIYNNRVRYRAKGTPQPEKQMMEEGKNQEEMEKLSQKDPERLWQINVQADKKSYALILCLLIINNAIIYRKYDKSVIEIDKQCELDEYYQENLSRYYQRSSFSNDYSNPNGIDSQIVEAEEPEAQQNPNGQGQRDIKVYQESDFVDNLNYLSRKGLLRLLSKILNKKPPTKIQVVCHSFTLQLTLQFYYMHENENENSSMKLIKKSINSLYSAIVSWQESDAGKYRIAYDVMMFLIQIKTWCGRDKINHQMLSEIRESKCMIKENREIEWAEDEKSNQTLRIIHELSQTQEIYEELKRSIQIYQSFCKRKSKQEKYVEGLEGCLKLWHGLNSCVDCIKQERETGKSYLTLFNMKNQTQDYLASPKYRDSISLYVENMLEDLDSVLDEVLKELSERLLVLFVASTKEQDQKFMVDFDTMLEKDYSSHYENQRLFRRITFNWDNQFHESLIKVKIALNKQNIDLLQKRGGCRFIIINGVNSVEIRKMLRIEQKPSKLLEDKIYQSLAKEFLKLRPQYLFVCLIKDNELIEALRKCRKKQQIIRYDSKKLHNKPDDALKCALMITISLTIATRTKDENSFTKAMQSMLNNEKILYRYKSTLQHDPNLQFQTFNCEQIRSMVVLEPFVQIEVYREDNYEHYHKIEIDYSEIIKEQYLSAIRSILSIIPMQISKKSSPHVQKSIDECVFQIFILNLKFYLKEQGYYYHFFDFLDEDFSHSLTSSQSKEHPTSSKFFEELLGEKSKKFLSVHNSCERMMVVIRNFTFNRKQAWMNQEIKSIFFETERTKLKTRYVKIGQVPCLISIRN